MTSKNLEWQAVFKERIIALQGRPASPTEFILKFAEETGANIHSVRTYYYKVQKEVNPEAVSPYVETATYNEKDDAWKLEMVGLIKENKGKFKGSQLAIKELAKKYGANAKTVENAYYRYITDIPEYLLEEYYRTHSRQVKTSTELPPEPEHEDEEHLNPMAFALQKAGIAPGQEISNYMPPNYRPSMFVKVRITRIDTFGAMVISMDGLNTSGLIHKSNIRNGYVNHVNKWLRFGDELEAQIIDYDRAKGKLALSTRHLPLKELGMKNLGLNEQGTGFTKTINTPQPTPTTVKEGNAMEIEQIKGYLNPVIGELSEEAVQELQRILGEVGVFRFTMALGQVVGGFKPDVGLMLMNNIKTSLDGK